MAKIICLVSICSFCTLAYAQQPYDPDQQRQPQELAGFSTTSPLSQAGGPISAEADLTQNSVTQPLNRNNIPTGTISGSKQTEQLSKAAEIIQNQVGTTSNSQSGPLQNPFQIAADGSSSGSEPGTSFNHIPGLAKSGKFNFDHRWPTNSYNRPSLMDILANRHDNQPIQEFNNRDRLLEAPNYRNNYRNLPYDSHHHSSSSSHEESNDDTSSETSELLDRVRLPKNRTQILDGGGDRDPPIYYSHHSSSSSHQVDNEDSASHEPTTSGPGLKPETATGPSSHPVHESHHSSSSSHQDRIDSGSHEPAPSFRPGKFRTPGFRTDGVYGRNNIRQGYGPRPDPGRNIDLYYDSHHSSSSSHEVDKSDEEQFVQTGSSGLKPGAGSDGPDLSPGTNPQSVKTPTTTTTLATTTSSSLSPVTTTSTAVSETTTWTPMESETFTFPSSRPPIVTQDQTQNLELMSTTPAPVELPINDATMTINNATVSENLARTTTTASKTSTKKNGKTTKKHHKNSSAKSKSDENHNKNNHHNKKKKKKKPFSSHSSRHRSKLEQQHRDALSAGEFAAVMVTCAIAGIMLSVCCMRRFDRSLRARLFRRTMSSDGFKPVPTLDSDSDQDSDFFDDHQPRSSNRETTSETKDLLRDVEKISID